MTVTLEISPELEQLLKRKAEAAGKDVARFAEELLAERLLGDDDAGNLRSTEEFIDELKNIQNLVPNHTVPADCDRESIYEGQRN